MSDESQLLVEKRGPALHLRINRPNALNSLTPEVGEGLSAGLRQAEAEDDVHAVVISGVGRAFCAGSDLKSVRGKLDDEKAQTAYTRRMAEVIDEIELARIPVIAAVNGVAVAGGLEIILACDLVVAAESAKIGDCHANFGVLPGGGVSARLPRAIGPAKAKYLMFTGDLLPARELMEAGLINSVVADDQLEDEVVKLVEKIAAKSPLGIARMKQLVTDSMEQPVSTSVRLELAMLDAHQFSNDMREGLAAFEEKRRPSFTGT